MERLHLTPPMQMVPKSPLRSLSSAEIEPSLSRIAEHYRAILEELGEDPSRPGLTDTPMRAAKAMMFFTKGM